MLPWSSAIFSTFVSLISLLFGSLESEVQQRVHFEWCVLKSGVLHRSVLGRGFLLMAVTKNIRVVYLTSYEWEWEVIK